jgi:hypothetical protein
MSQAPRESTADDARVVETMNVLAAQRDSALNLVAELRGELAAKAFEHDLEVRNLQARVVELVEEAKRRNPE